uniref:Protein kinase domain-containing protein n=1 Tax=Setaria italica TaxID=4555 RepID=K3ZBV4_SETIT
MAELPANKLTDFMKIIVTAKGRLVNNHNINCFTEDEIKRITNSYSTLIGEGGFGQVYKGALDDGTTVAVKRYMRQNLTEGFVKEVIVHCQINHKNVVRLLGFCMEENAFMIVTEYVSGGNLHNLLHGSDYPISLDARLRIAIECADALGDMHSMYQPIIHGDIKPDNILLDSKLVAKLTDFGLSRLLCMDKTQYTVHVAGSRGYMDPEYIETGLLDPKSDVYSFGVVLLELITRSKASESGFCTRLGRNFTDALRKGKKEARKMFDTEIANDKYTKILDGIGNLAAECLTKGIKERPEMKNVQERLQFLRRALHREQAQEKVGQKSSILGIFNGNNARRKHFERNGGLILQETSGLNIFTEQSLEKITCNYSNVAGKGYLGCAYMGWVDDNTRVVVTRFILPEEAETDSILNERFILPEEARTYSILNELLFLNERFILPEEARTYSILHELLFEHRISHKNIIRLVGCCLETVVPLFVYEFAANGSLYDVLHGDNGKCRLSLDSRLNIAIGSAEALAYLHSVRATRRGYGNITSSNILLDHNFLPKVSVSFLESITFKRFLYEISFAYVDPVYLKTGKSITKSDVYSFGIVLLELITRKGAKYRDGATTLWKEQNSGKPMFDKEVAVEGCIAILEEMGKLAVECLKEDVDERPEMVEVAERLQNLRRDWKHGEGGCGSSHAKEETTGGH